MTEHAVAQTSGPAVGGAPRLLLLLATDGSGIAALGRNAALDLASRNGWSLHVVHAWQAPIPVSQLALLTPGHPSSHREEGVSVLDGEHRFVESQGAHVSAEHLIEGRPAEAILRVADEVDAGLVVVGSRGLGLIGRIVTGTVSETVLHQSRRPVLMVRGGSDSWPPSHVVAADDGSAAAADAARLAGVIARSLEVPMVLIQVLPHLDGILSSKPGMSIDTVLGGAEVALGDRAEEIEGLTGESVRTRLSFGSPVEGILDTAILDGPRPLLACGSRGTGLRQRMRLGSVSRGLLHASHLPILVVPPARVKGHR